MKIIIDYKKHYDENGYCYNQTITLPNNFIKYINKLIKKYHNSTDDIKKIICNEIGISIYYDCYLKELPKNNIIYLGLTQLKFIYYYLSINGFDVSKIKARNSIVKVVNNG